MTKEHDPVPFYTGPVLEPELPQGWDIKRDDAGFTWGTGPCPYCHGEAGGPPLDAAEEHGASAARVGDFVAQCICGQGHPNGDKTETTCGHRFLVRARVEGSQ